MFETVAAGFRNARNRLKGEVELTEKMIDEALRDIRVSLLEADVEFKVTKRFLRAVKEKALGQVVKIKAGAGQKKKKVTPYQAFVKICLDELTAMMGPVDTSLKLNPKGPTKIMLVGLQGSGKTTTAAKLARLFEKEGKKPMLVAADVYRPAAIEQLKVLGRSMQIPVFNVPDADPPEICRLAIDEAKKRYRDLIIFDTAGRLAVDEPLMEELDEIKRQTSPENILLVIDSMIGQDSVKTAVSFNERLNLEGVVLTKLDGDARGGAALSVKAATGKPIKYVGMGESLDRLEEFRPDGLASRIMGFGDIESLMRDFEEVVDEDKAEEDAVRMMKGKFGFDDFLNQIQTIQKMGSMKDLFDKMPFFPDGLPDGVNLDDRELDRVTAIISSMTRQERTRPEVLFTVEKKTTGKGKKKRQAEKFVFQDSRVKRIAKGSGRKEEEVRDLCAKFRWMRQLLKQFGMATGVLGKIPGLGQIRQARQMMKMMEGGGDPSEMMGGMGGMPMPGMGGPMAPGAEGPAPGVSGKRVPQSAVARKQARQKRKNARKARRKSRK